jgi:hypothetical protein
MNKYEQLIEYIINDQEDKARELFHSIVVAKSRDIYESLMDETVDQYDQQGGLVDDVTRDENGGLGEADDEFGGEMDADDGMGDDMGGEEEFGDEMGDDEMGDEFGGDDLGDDMGGDDMGGEGDLSDKFQDIKSAIDSLEAEFQAIMGGGDEMDAEMGDGEIEGGDEMAADDAGEDFGGAPEEIGAEEEEPMGESANPFAKKSGSGKAASGSGKSGSGKSGSGKAASGSGKAGSGNPFAKKGSGSGKNESRSAAELMREYVEKISDGHGPEKHGEAEGNEVGSDRKSFPVNKTTPVAGKNDMGGTASNILSGKGNDTSEKDGQTSKAKAGGFVKAPTSIPGSERNVNKVGGNAGAQQFFKTKAKAKDSEGSTTKDSVPVSKDSLGYAKK